MCSLMVRDIPENRELDDAAMAELKGGLFGFLAGLHADVPGSRLVPSVTNNFLIDYNQTIVQQNPVNVILEGNSNVIDSLNITNVNLGDANVFQDVG